MGYVLQIFFVVWWLRSPRSGNSNNFVNVNTSGNVNNNNANNSYGVAPGSSLGRQSNLRAKSVQGGEKECMTLPGKGVNICSDRFERTLLAWQGLVVILCFMLSNLMRLS